MVSEKVDTVRLRNFLILFEQFKQMRWEKWPDEPERGMLRRFAEHLELNHTWLSNVKSGSKILGVKNARHIERKMGVSEGWLDTDHSRDESMSSDDDKAFRDSVMAIYRQAPEASRALLLRAFQALLAGKPIDESLVASEHGSTKRKKLS